MPVDNYSSIKTNVILSKNNIDDNKYFHKTGRASGGNKGNKMQFIKSNSLQLKKQQKTAEYFNGYKPVKLNKTLLCMLLSLAIAPASGYAHVNKKIKAQVNNLSQQNDTVKGKSAGDGLVTLRSESIEEYSTIKERSAGDSLCLTLNADNKNVAFSTCENTSRQRWKVSPQMVGYFKITSQALAGESTEYCLGTTGTTPAMMECSGSGYSSYRAWQITPRQIDKQTDLFYTLKNKYREDLGKKEVLGHSANRLAMVSESQTSAFSWQLSLPDMIHTRPVTGVKKVLVIHSHYSDRAANPLERMKLAVFGTGHDTSSLASAVRIASHGKLTLTGDVVSDINLGPRPATCSDSVVAQAKKLAEKKGINLSGYDYFFVDLPSSPCSWSGLASMPGNWIIGNNSGEKHWMWQHEFGHSLGAPHATSLENCSVDDHGVVQLDDKCKSTAASDPSDSMNGGGRRLYPAPYALYTGWLTAEQFPAIKNDGDYTLAPLFNNDNNIKGLRVLRSNGSYLTLEYRQPSEGFEDWATDSPFVNGVIVRIATFGSKVTNQLVDTTPGSAGGMSDAPLMPGKSIDDLLSGKRITLLKVDAQGAHVRIQNIADAENEEDVDPVAVVPQNFTVIARQNEATIRLLDGSASKGKEMVWKSLTGNGVFALQEGESGPVVQESKVAIARAIFPAGETGTAKYELTATGSHGKTDSKTVTVTVVPAEATITGKNSVAHGQVATFSSEGNFKPDTWLWVLRRNGEAVELSHQSTFTLDTQHVAAGSYQVELEASASNRQYRANAIFSLAITEEKPDTPPEPEKPDAPAYPAYVEGTPYKAGDTVTASGGVYSCKPHPYTGWCAGAAWAYAPGTGSHWSEAWDKVG